MNLNSVCLLWSLVAVAAYFLGFILGNSSGKSQAAIQAIKPHHLQARWWRSRIAYYETRQYEKAKNPNED